MPHSHQAPLDDTIGDFWHCIVHHQVNFHLFATILLFLPLSQVRIVVMLTALTEGTKVIYKDKNNNLNNIPNIYNC